jgi:hypothetical protein
MPTNLPPEYFEADKRYREAQTQTEKIACLEELISTIPKHKGTDHLRADLRRQLSRLKEEAQSKKKHSTHQATFHIEKEGAGTAILLGCTNTGKSALIAALTHAEPEISPVPFTTWHPIPGMMPVDNIQVQLVDTPPLDRDFVEPVLFDLVRRADVILLVIDIQADPLSQLEKCHSVLAEHYIFPAEMQDRSAIQGRAWFIPSIILVNKCDDLKYDDDFAVLCELFEGECPLLPVSAMYRRNFDLLKHRVVECLDIIRVYARPPGKEPDLERPFVLKKGSTIADLAPKIHRDFAEKLKSARVWGSAVFDGQLVHKDYVLQDGDIVELRI